MKIEITKREKNPVLGREDIEYRVKDVKTTPSRQELRKRIAALTGVAEETTVVASIEHGFGQNETSGKARAYESKEKMEQIEQKHLIARNLGKKEKEGKKEAAEAAPPEKGEEEKKAEEGETKAGKEEKKEEAKEAAKGKPEEKKAEKKEEEKK